MASSSNSNTGPAMSAPRRPPLRIGLIGFDLRARAIVEGLAPVVSQMSNARFATAEFRASVHALGHGMRQVKHDVSRHGCRIEFGVKQDLTVARESDLIILACYSDRIRWLLTNRNAQRAFSSKVCVSLAAGFTINDMEKTLYPADKQQPPPHQRCSFFRAAPNVAASVRASATAIAQPTNPPPTREAVQFVQSIFLAVGTVTEVPEAQIYGCRALSRATPAFLAMFCAGIVDGAVSVGLHRDLAEQMTAQALRSMAALWSPTTNISLARVREDVTKDDEITNVGLNVLEKGQINVEKAIEGALYGLILADLERGD